MQLDRLQEAHAEEENELQYHGVSARERQLVRGRANQREASVHALGRETGYASRHGRREYGREWS
jgi:hypothetical protein